MTDRVEYIYKCNCIKNDRRVTNSKRIVEVDKEGVCIDCGFYAVVEKKIYTIPDGTGKKYVKKSKRYGFVGKPVTVYILETLLKVGIYPSIKECAKKLGMKFSTVSQYFTDGLTQTRGYIIIKGYNAPIPIARLEKMNTQDKYKGYLAGKISFINFNSTKGVKHISLRE